MPKTQKEILGEIDKKLGDYSASVKLLKFLCDTHEELAFWSLKSAYYVEQEIVMIGKKMDKDRAKILSLAKQLTKKQKQNS